MFGIIGSGFGLYGHMPAVCQLGQDPVLLPKRYFPVFEKRTELSVFRDQINWVEDEATVIEKAEDIVLSLWPKGQEELLNKCLSSSHVRSLILEKPLAPSPISSINLFTQLESSGKIFRINYAFIYTTWFDQLKHRLSELNAVKINWSFLAHHYKYNLQNWKRHLQDGGGVIRFFGIHLIAVLSALNFNQVIYSEVTGISDEDLYHWKAGFKNTEGVLCEIVVDSFSSSENFKIEGEATGKGTAGIDITLKNPFDNSVILSDGLDYRINGLVMLYKSLMEKQENTYWYSLYQSTNNLWKAIESASSLNIIKK